MDDNTGDGSVLSNNDTIHALRQGVAIEMRTDSVLVSDHTGEKFDIPLRLVETDKLGGKTVPEVARDVIEEVERRASGPRRRAGLVKLGSIDSFVAYVNRFQGGDDKDTAVFAPLTPPSFTAIFDYHPKGHGPAAWCVDRATYECPLSRQWSFWTGLEGKVFKQEDFADIIEQNQLDLRGDETREPKLASASKMREFALHLVVNVNSKFERRINQQTGEQLLISKDEHDVATNTKKPDAFGLFIPVFEGSDARYVVECQFRMNMVGETTKKPHFSFVMMNRLDVFDEALGEVRARVAAECGVPVFVGQPPAAK